MRRHPIVKTLVLFLPCLLVLGAGRSLAQVKIVRDDLAAPKKESPVTLRFLDSATGFAIQPDVISLRSGPGAARKRVEFIEPGKGGRIPLQVGSGAYSMEIEASGYLPMMTTLAGPDEAELPVHVYLTPTSPPGELQSGRLRSLHREGFMLIVGFVGDDERGGPLPGVEVSAGAARTKTDARGYFQLYIPVPAGASTISEADLTFAKPGHEIQERRHVEIWSNGDWIYRVRLAPGHGRSVVDEKDSRRREPEEEGAAPPAPASGASAFQPEEPLPPRPKISSVPIRIPRNIRVQTSSSVDHVPFDYTCDGCLYYMGAVLPAEWPPQHGSLNNGLGMNGLLAGAVAVRSYAIGFVNVPDASTYDICGTTTCQVYNSSLSNSNTDTANRQTKWIVVVNSSGKITKRMAAHSKENNHKGACPDGYMGDGSSWPCRPDPVCTGVENAGHGWGMCQDGSVRWATGYFNLYSTPHQPNGQQPQSWQWIVDHYYPDFQRTQGQPLVTGDSVVVFGTGSIGLKVRECAGGGIESGVSCPQKGIKFDGATGVILDGPQLIKADGLGHTWWRIRWDSDGLVGWSAENWLERSASAAPAGGTLQVRGTRDGASWSGSVSYQISGPSGSSGSAVPADLTSQPAGVYTLSYLSGGPAGTTLDSITPASSQTLSSGGTLTFTLNFKTPVQPLPSVSTNPATNIGQTAATLWAYVDPKGGSATVSFDYGTSTGYGSTVTYGSSVTTARTVSRDISGLQCGTTYHFRARASTSAGSATGDDATFKTAACVTACTPDFSLGCGGSDGWNNGAAGSTDVNDQYACLPYSYQGPEYTYVFHAPFDTHLRVRLTSSQDLDLIILRDLGDGCKSGNCVGHGAYSGNEDLGFGALEGHTYYIVVDGYNGAVGDYAIQLDCDGATFSDVPPSLSQFKEIQALYNVGITQGCSASPRLYCPDNSVSRAEMAAFLERSLRSRYFIPPPASGIFQDVPASFWAAPWIEQLSADGITKGCATNPPFYCPDQSVSRAEMAPFLLRARHGGSYVPPPATGIFSDVPLSHWAAPWIEQLYREGITLGCALNPLSYCPDQPVTRAQMAVFLARTFGVPLP